MKLLYTSDIHADNSHLKSMLSTAEGEKVDALIVGGDLIPHRLPQIGRQDIFQAQKTYLESVFLPSIEAFKHKLSIPIYLDLANDDFIGVRPLLEAQNGKIFFLLHMEKYPLTDTVDILGYMAVSPTPFSRKDWEKPDSRHRPFVGGNRISLDGYVSSEGLLKQTVLDLNSDDTIESDLIILSEKIDKPFIFISHCPPYNTPLDMLFNGTHVGSVSIRDFIEKWSESGRLISSFHGHIHESPNISGSIRTRIGNCHCTNPGQGSGKNAAFQYAVFEIEDAPKPEIHFR